MSIWSRIAESLAAIGESVGGYLTRLAERRTTAPEKSVAFTIGMIALGAKMAKADGIVTEREVAAFKQVFQVPERDIASVARVFNLAKQDVAGFELYARQIARLFHAKAAVLEDVLDGLFHIAKADEEIHPAELAFLTQVAAVFGFEPADFARIRARHVVARGASAYAVLGLSPEAGLDEIKQRYRKLVRDNHPDKHIAAGVPPEMVALATRRLQAINEAYAEILKERAA
jgi:DnaJ like chaperone protein